VRPVFSGAITASAVALLALAPSAQAAWNQPVGGASPINQAANRSAVDPSLAELGGVPYVAWSETDGVNFELRVSRLNAAGTTWDQVAGGSSPINEANNRDALEPSLASIGGTLYVAWSEGDGTNREIRVARLNAAGTAWSQPVGGASPINEDASRSASSPSLAGIGGVPYVAWSEGDGANDEIRVARLNAAGTAWEKVGQTAFPTSPINRSGALSAESPSLAGIEGVPYVAWWEDDGTNREIRVARLNAAKTGWDSVGQPGDGITSGGINQSTSQDASEPSLAAIGGVPWVAWTEKDGFNREIRVARLDAAGTAWEQPVGGASPINQANDLDARGPSLAVFGGVPYVAWYEDDGANEKIRVARLNAAGTAWEQPVGGANPINQANDQVAFVPNLSSIGGVPWVAWIEEDGTNAEARVSRLEPEFLGPPTASASDTSATLSVSVRAFGLPYQVGFDYGPGLASQTSTTQTSADAEVVSQTAGGLSPSTGYGFRPFATVGVPAPRILGEVQVFTTVASTPTDTTPPTGSLSGKSTQDVDKLALTIGSDEAAAASGQASVNVPGAKKPVTSKPATGNVAASGTLKLRFKFKKSALKMLKKSIAKGKKPKAKLSVTLTDTAGNVAPAKKSVKLKN
jgi:hypothetical protein